MDLAQVGDRRARDAIEGVEAAGEELGHPLAHERDAEGVQEPGEPTRLATLDGADEVLGRLRAVALQGRDLLAVSV